jgi:hypothetical protein
VNIDGNKPGWLLRRSSSPFFKKFFTTDLFLYYKSMKHVVKLVMIGLGVKME